MSNRGITNLTSLSLDICTKSVGQYKVNGLSPRKVEAIIHGYKIEFVNIFLDLSYSAHSYPLLSTQWPFGHQLLPLATHFLPSSATIVLGQEINQSERQYVLGNLTASYRASVHAAPASGQLYRSVPLWRDLARSLWYKCPWIFRREFKVVLWWASPYSISNWYLLVGGSLISVNRPYF